MYYVQFSKLLLALTSTVLSFEPRLTHEKMLFFLRVLKWGLPFEERRGLTTKGSQVTSSRRGVTGSN
jgi:hypothetical protein